MARDRKAWSRFVVHVTEFKVTRERRKIIVADNE
jgi:hypothetical protein